MRLIEVIAYLERAPDLNYTPPVGLGSPHSWRGSYDCLAFEPVANISVSEMLDNALSALDKTFEGYKGGSYRMTEDTECYIDCYGVYSADSPINETVMKLITGELYPVLRAPNEKS